MPSARRILQPAFPTGYGRRAEQAPPSRLLDLAHGHPGEVEAGIEEWPDGRADQVAQHHTARCRRR